MHKAVAFQTGGQMRKLNLFFQVDTDVIIFAAFGNAASVTFAMRRCSLVWQIVLDSVDQNMYTLALEQNIAEVTCSV